MIARAFCFAAALLAALLTAVPADSLAVDWTWVAGDSGMSQYGVYGTKGVGAPANTPGSRHAATGTLGADGDGWLFGGYGYGASGSDGTLNDLWKHDGSQWTWVSGASSTNGLPVYGTQGVAAPTNVPGGRLLHSSCVDGSGDLWVFGGQGMNQNGEIVHLNDLWKFDGTDWTYVSGSKTGNVAGVYGTKGVAAATNVPGARRAAILWRDGTGNLWLFGGYGWDGATGQGALNDVWRFDGTYWTWMAGSNQVDQAGSYGVKGTASPTNTPGGRSYVTGWADGPANRLWLFGGYGKAAGAGPYGYLNDLWRFDVATLQWTWTGGSTLTNQQGVYGTMGVASPTNQPGSRYWATMWATVDGNVWLYGGHGCDSYLTSLPLADLWKWDGTDWTFMSGVSSGLLGSNHGTIGVPAPEVTPGSRYSSASWFTPDDGKLWLFGGHGLNFGLASGMHGDLWSRQLPELQPPDLVVSEVFAPTSVVNGCSMVLAMCTVINQGGDAGECLLGVYLSADSVITTDDTLVLELPISALGPAGEHAVGFDLQLPEFPQETMYVGFLADHAAAVTESDETNNARATAVSDPSPRILSIADVRNDQGRWVRLRFERSSRDAAGSTTPILQYEAYRRVDADAAPSLRAGRAPLAPDGTALAGWEFAGAVPAHGEDEYSMVVPTLKDSSAAGPGTSAFFLRAATAAPTTFFDSCRDSGWSVDNLPPAAPAPFAAVPVAGANVLHWGLSPEADLAHYRLYRGSVAGFTPGPGNLVAEPPDTGYVDVAGACFYKLSAVDVNGNESGHALAQVTSVVGVTPPGPPRELALAPALPNPARQGVAWQLALPRTAHVRAEVLDAAGRRVARLADAELEAGVRALRWELRDDAGRQVKSGTYFLRVRVDGRSLVGTFTVVR